MRGDLLDVLASLPCISCALNCPYQVIIFSYLFPTVGQPALDMASPLESQLHTETRPPPVPMFLGFRGWFIIPDGWCTSAKTRMFLSPTQAHPWHQTSKPISNRASPTPGQPFYLFLLLLLMFPELSCLSFISFFLFSQKEPIDGSSRGPRIVRQLPAKTVVPRLLIFD